MNAEANVACPHKFTSQAGENHLILLLDKSTKAVSDKLFSAAIFCINTSSSKSEKITAAGLPEKISLVKASTKYTSSFISL